MPNWPNIIRRFPHLLTAWRRSSVSPEYILLGFLRARSRPTYRCSRLRKSTVAQRIAVDGVVAAAWRMKGLQWAELRAGVITGHRVREHPTHRSRISASPRLA
jgi:hypothetical protein